MTGKRFLRAADQSKAGDTVLSFSIGGRIAGAREGRKLSLG